MSSTLAFSGARRTPVVLQTESAECALACLAMVAASHGYDTDLASLRRAHRISMKGTTLTQLVAIAERIELAARPLRIELEALDKLALPAILHWDLNHFVVLTRVKRGSLTIHDPARGRVTLSIDEASQHFTGIALELAPTARFTRRTERRSIGLAQLVGRLPGALSTFLQVFLLAGALEVFVLASPFYMQWVIDDVVVSEDSDLLTVLALGFLLLALIQVAIRAFRAWVLMVLGTALNLQLTGNLFRHLLGLPMGFFARRHLGDVVSRFESANVIQRTLTSAFIEAVVDGVMALATLTMMVVYSWKLAAVVVGVAACYAAVRLALYRPLRQASEEQILRDAKQQSNFLETVRGIQSIKLFNRQQRRRTLFQNLMVDNFNAKIRVEKLGIAFSTVNGSLFGVENVVIVWLGASLILSGALSVGMLFAFMAYKQQFITRIIGFIEKGIDFRMLELHRERVADIALSEPEVAAPGRAIDVRELEPCIEVRNVSFRYSDADPWIVRRVSLKIRAGESVAIVGPSGCGKSTLLKVMLGLLPPTRGEVLVGGVPLASIGIERYRELVGAVMQDDQLFAGSVAENISFSDHDVDQARVEQVACLAAIHEEIAAMPMGYGTLIGDMGTVLSGGQKQRVLLARALHARPRILFLDEATSHLDVARERMVNEAIRRLDMTRVIVAHRPETVASADRFVVLGSQSGEPRAPAPRAPRRQGSLRALSA